MSRSFPLAFTNTTDESFERKSQKFFERISNNATVDELLSLVATDSRFITDQLRGPNQEFIDTSILHLVSRYKRHDFVRALLPSLTPEQRSTLLEPRGGDGHGHYNTFLHDAVMLAKFDFVVQVLQELSPQERIAALIIRDIGDRSVVDIVLGGLHYSQRIEVVRDIFGLLDEEGRATLVQSLNQKGRNFMSEAIAANFFDPDYKEAILELFNELTIKEKLFSLAMKIETGGYSDTILSAYHEMVYKCTVEGKATLGKEIVDSLLGSIQEFINSPQASSDEKSMLMRRDDFKSFLEDTMKMNDDRLVRLVVDSGIMSPSEENEILTRMRQIERRNPNAAAIMARQASPLETPQQDVAADRGGRAG